MLLILSESQNPYFNIAAEEYLLKYDTREIIFLYTNQPSVIVGKHQNALKEVNFPFIDAHNIPVVRRISGGGTVYHDTGNLNFTFFTNKQEGNLVDFASQTKPIIQFLKDKYNLNAHFEGHNDLRINGKKISGNAEHVFKNRVLHHGTLLFDANLDNLRAALKIDARYKDRAVASVPAHVANISQFLEGQKVGMEVFKTSLQNYLQAIREGIALHKFTETDFLEIEKLMDEKYIHDHWNYGYSPKFTYNIEFDTPKGRFRVEFQVEKQGVIQSASIAQVHKGYNTGLSDFDFLKGVEFYPKTLLNAFEQNRDFLMKLLGLAPKQLQLHLL